MVGLAIGVYTALGLLATSGAVQYLDLESGWTYETRGPWQARVDHRGLMAMHHPWQPSEEGNFAMAWRDVTLPDDWQGPVELAFYNSDDYHTSPGDAGAASMAAEAFIGHRRKQVLVNNVPIWSEDVSDPVRPGAPAYIRVPVALDAATRTIRIAFLAFDTHASSVVGKEDYYRPSKPGLTRETDPDAARFRTTVYWGDVALVSGDTKVSVRPRPSERNVLERHNRDWPPKPNLAPWKGKSFDLAISGPELMPEAGFPLEMGLPFPSGMVANPDGFRLRAGSTSLYAQRTADATWQDESLRWAQVRFPVKRGMKSVSLSFDDDNAKAPSALVIVEAEDTGLQLESSAVGWATAQGDPLLQITHKKDVIVETLRLSLESAGESVPGTNDRWRVIDSGPYYACVALEGRFEGLTQSFGSYALYVSSYQGLPYLKLWLRVFNDTPRNLDLAHLRVDLVLPEKPGALTVPHGPMEGDFSLLQTDATHYTLGESVFPSEKPFFVQWDRGAVAIKHFRALFPKGLALSDNVLSLDLCAGGNRPVSFTPGEANSHEIWLSLGKTDGAALAAVVEQPPILQNPAYWCETGVFGPAAPLDPSGPRAAFLTETYAGKDWTAMGQSEGLRHFPDGPYLGRTGEWANNYDGRMMGLWSTWAMTGDRAWFDRAAAVSAHVMDVAIVHSDVPGREWLGAMHGPGANHVAGPWNPSLRSEGLALYGQLTGNPEAETDSLGVADYCVRSGAGLRGVSTRHFAGPFTTLCAAYRETGEITFLEAGANRLSAMMERVDRRRGTWIDWHGSEVYPGTSPWMAADLAAPLYAWYQLTGDVEAAQLLVGLAEAVICENTPWETPGAMRTYSPNPRFGDTTAYDPVVLPLLLAAHELTEDSFFLEAAEAQWRRWLAAPEHLPVFNLAASWPWVNRFVAKRD